MVDQNYSQLFSCPRCGMTGAIYIVKVVGNRILIKQRCPRHGGRSFKVPLIERDNYYHLIHDNVYRCYKCGKEAIVSFVKQSGPWTLIKCTCQIHGRMPVQKIWNTVYSEISRMEPIEQQPPPQSQPVENDRKMFCSSCRASLKPNDKYCGSCGIEVE